MMCMCIYHFHMLSVFLHYFVKRNVNISRDFPNAKCFRSQITHISHHFDPWIRIVYVIHRLHFTLFQKGSLMCLPVVLRWFLTIKRTQGGKTTGAWFLRHLWLLVSFKERRPNCKFAFHTPQWFDKLSSWPEKTMQL